MKSILKQQLLISRIKFWKQRLTLLKKKFKIKRQTLPTWNLYTKYKVNTVNKVSKILPKSQRKLSKSFQQQRIAQKQLKMKKLSCKIKASFKKKIFKEQTITLKRKDNNSKSRTQRTKI